MSSHFSMFRVRPNCPPSITIRRASSATDDWSPANVRSSRYPMASSDFSETNRGCIVLQNKRGPRGSPCCGPSLDNSVEAPYSKDDELEYAEKIDGYNSGTLSNAARNISPLCKELNAFEKSNLINTF